MVAERMPEGIGDAVRGLQGGRGCQGAGGGVQAVERAQRAQRAQRAAQRPSRLTTHMCAPHATPQGVAFPGSMYLHTLSPCPTAARAPSYIT